MNRTDPGDTRNQLDEYRRGTTDIRGAGFWITFIIAPVFAWAFLLIWLAGRAF